MATTQQLRQSQLFAAEDWRVIYTAFTQVNFNAYDFNTIRTAMITYIRLNYPEDFNDWIESSEFVALIDLLSYLGQSLAFRMDLNTRENFLDTATRRDSIFRLARMLNYQPQRSIPASGLLKVTTVITDQPLVDSYGTNLQNVQIVWNDQNNPDWFEQFILVINATLNSSNPFGNPSMSGSVAGIPTQIYAMNNTGIPTSVIPFSATIGGNSVNLELVNASFNTGNSYQLANSGNFYEIDPDPLNSWNLIYKADGNGYASPNTGFFLYFKQGTMQFRDYQCSVPLANRVIDVDTNGVNQTDVWVQNIDSNGLVTKKWTQVPSVNGFNVIYNSLDKNIRDIYSVITRDNAGSDQISIRFADGNFGNVPIGVIRVWHRVSNNLTYQIRPRDIANQVFAMQYTDNLNNIFNVAFTTNLQYTVNNAQSTESNTSIAQNAPQTYYTQDRMVNGEDYNLFPLQDARILKNKSVNRFYSGQSRYLDLNDPTGSYNDLNVFGTDGIIYSENDQNSRDVQKDPGINTSVVVNMQIQPLINGSFGSQTQALELKNFFYYNYPRYSLTTGCVWKSVTNLSTSSTGAFYSGSTALQIGNYASVGSPLHYLTQGSLVEFTDGTNTTLASIVGIVGDGTGIGLSGITNGNVGAVTLSTVLKSGLTPVWAIPSYRTVFNQDEITAIASALNTLTTFGIRYDPVDLTWNVITSDNLNTSTTFSLQYAGNTSSTNLDNSWLIKVDWTGTSWRIYSRAFRYIFESVRQNRFYFENTKKIFDPNTNTAQLDYVSVLGINPDPITNYALGQEYKWQVTGQQIYPDGFSDPKSVRVTMWEGLNYGIPDDPDEYNKIVDPQTTPSKMLFWESLTSSDGYQYWSSILIPISLIFANPSTLPPATSANWNQGDVAYIISNNQFLQWNGSTLVDVTSTHKMRIGRNNVSFLWKHFAPTDQRINPAVTNVIDMYVLTSAYDIDLRNWIATNGSSSIMPVPLTSSELKAAFIDLEQYKQMTDQIIWHPVSYKVLFGAQADPEYRVVFKVVKTPGTTVTDNEVKSLVIQAVNNYFGLSHWDFGQSFFFTELAAYIHQQLATIVGTIVITPLNAQAKFGDLFEISCNADEIFISGARVTDVQIVPSLTETVLGISNG